MGSYYPMPNFTDCEDIVNKDGTACLSIMSVPGTLNVRLERYILSSTRPKKLEMACTIENAQHEVSDDKTVPLRDRYIEMLRKQYGFVTIRRHLEPYVNGFHCITSEGEADSFVALAGSCRLKAKETHSRLCNSNSIKGVYDCGPVPKGFGFQINLVNATGDHEFTAVSVMHSPGAGLDCFEIDLRGADGSLVRIYRLGMGDVYRFGSFDELVAGLVRLANNLRVVDEEYTN